MPRNKKFEGDMTEIGQVRTPPFAKTPDIHALFENRHNRFDRLAPTSPIKDYIEFLSHFTKAQHKTALEYANHSMPVTDIKRAKEFRMPPIDRQSLIAHESFEKIATNFFQNLSKSGLNAQSLLALDHTLANKSKWQEWAKNLMEQHLVEDTMAQHIFMMGAVQIAFSIASHQLPEKELHPLDGNLCPSCGGTHSASMVVGWAGSEGTRFCSCLYCGTLWNYVRIKCTFCEATGGIEYREIDGGPGSILAETCQKCHQYCKTMDHQKDVFFDVFADDIGSIALDLLMQDDGKFTRGAFNPFLAGY